MDLSAEVSAALRLLGDISETGHATYQQVLQQVIEDTIKDTQASSSTPCPGGEDDGEHYSKCNRQVVYHVSAATYRHTPLPPTFHLNNSSDTAAVFPE